MSRRQVFAREPIRPKSGAPAKGSSNTPDAKPHRIDKSFIERFQKATMEPNLANVLTITSASLGFKISAQGNTDTFIHGPNGMIIADHRDVQAISGMNTFVQGERKLATKEKVTGSFMKVLFALSQKSDKPVESLPQWDNAFLGVYKPVEALLKTLARNIEQVSQVPTEGTEEIVRKHILASNTRIRNAIGRFLLAKFEKTEADKKLNDFYFEENVPIWVVNRLTQSYVDLKSSKGGISSFYFPRDLSKGLSLTFKEITSPRFTKSQLGLMSGNEEIIAFFNRKDMLLPFLSIDSESKLLTDETAFANELANVPILMIPPECSLDLVVDIARKTGIKGYSWSVGRTISARDNLRFLGTVFKRLHFLALPNPRAQVSLIEEMFPGFMFNRNDADKDPFVQLSKFLSENTDDNLFGYLSKMNMGSNFDSVKVHRKMLLQILGLPESRSAEIDSINASFHVKFVSELPDDYDLELIQHQRIHLPVQAEGVADVWGDISHRISATDIDSAAVKEVLVKIYKKPADRVQKEGPINLANVRSGLGVNAAALVSALMKRREVSLAKRMDAWFRSFLSVSVQNACASMLSARFSVVFSETIEYSREDYAGIYDFSGFDEVLHQVDNQPDDEVQPQEDEFEREEPGDEPPS